MPQPTGPTDPNLLTLIKQLRGKKEYAALARQLGRSRRAKTAVNVGRLNSLAKGQALAVPGSVLSVGKVTKPITVYAWHFSKNAQDKIEQAGGTCRSLTEIVASKEKFLVVKHA